MHLRTWTVALVISGVTFGGCAFFNTFFNARKAYNQAQDQLRKYVRDTQKRSTAGKLTPQRFGPEPDVVPDAIRQQFDIVIEKTSKVVALHPDSRWVDDAILLMGKALYYRGDYLDARNRFEVFMFQYPDDEKFPQARFWYAKTLIRLDLVADALQHLQAVSDETSDPQLKMKCAILSGDAMVTQDLFEQAARAYTDALTYRGHLELKQEALFKRAYVYFTASRYDEAAASLRELLKTSLDSDEAFDVTLMMSRSLKELGRYDEALRTIHRLLADIRNQSYFGSAELEAADVLRRKGEFELASAQFKNIITAYENPQIKGTAYYFLGVMNDEGGPFADVMKAQRYYQLVSTRYAQSEYVPDARKRFEFLQNMAYLRGSIDADRNLLAAIDIKIATGEVNITDGPDTTVNESELELDEETLRELIRQDSLLKAGGNVDIRSLENDEGFTDVKEETGNLQAQDELASVNIDNKPLIEKMSSVRQEIELLNTLSEHDSLQRFRNRIHLRVADDYLMLADHFQHQLGQSDSALHYYEWIAREYEGTSREERARYSIAGIYQRRQSAAWKDILQDTYARFPDGEYASMARKLLGLSNHTASAETSLLLAEQQIIDGTASARTIDLLESMAGLDSLPLKERALYNLGLIHERWRNESEKAFSYYYTLTRMSPQSPLSQHVKAKVDAYLKEHEIDEAGTERFIHTSFYKPAVLADGNGAFPTDSLFIADSTQTVLMDSTVTISDTSSTRSKKLLDDDEIIKNPQQPGKRKQEKEAIRRDEIDE
jgi:TolA-binding protein